MQIHFRQLDELEQLEEWRVETIVPEDKASVVAKVLKANHPYEEPALSLFKY